MKVFDLICGGGHRFEGWFGSAERYAEQTEAGSVHCPLCHSSEIRREPSAPRIGSTSHAAEPTRKPDAPATSEAAMFGHLRRLVAGTENVGARFAEEARRIHYEEVPPRPIRGTATERERRDLRDEGIETLSIAIPAALTETIQ